MSEQQLGLLLQQGRLYFYLSRPKRLLRLIAQDSTGQTLLFKVVSLKWSIQPTEVIAWGRDFALELRKSNRLHECVEQIRPPFMSWTDEELVHQFESSRNGVDIDQNRAWLAARDQELKEVQELVGAESIYKTYSPETQASVIRAYVERLAGRDARDPVAEQRLRRLLHRYAWFGMGANSLLKLVYQRGKTEGLVRKFSTKTGAPNALVKLGASEHYAGRNIAKHDLAIFVDALQRWYIALNYSYQETYDHMVEYLYVQKTKNSFGEEVVWPISRHKIPAFFAFEKRARRLVRELGLNVKKAGPLDGKELESRRGYDADIGPRFGDVFCMDATPFNKESVLEVELDGESKNVGKHTVVVVRDRATGDPRGWHLYTGAENWDEGYRLAMLCAITSKTVHLKYLGIDDPDAWKDDENIAPLSVVFDGGPAAGKDAEAAFDRLDIRSRPAAPGNPPQKGGVEGLIGRVQNEQSRDAGGYKRTAAARDREARRLAKKFASEDHYKIERDLVLSLLEERSKLNKEHLWTIEMKKEGVSPNSADIVRWSVQKMGGVQMRLLNEATAYLALLKHRSCQVLLDGIHLLKSKYQSVRLQTFRHAFSGKLSVKVLYHPTRPEEAYWVTPEGHIDVLQREKRGRRLHGRLSATEIELVALRARASKMLKEAADSKAKAKKRGEVSVQQHKMLLGIASRVPSRQRPSATEEIGKMRNLQLQLQRESRPYDTEAAHVPSLARTRAMLPPVQVAPAARAELDTESLEKDVAIPSMPANDANNEVEKPAPSASRRANSAALWFQRMNNGNDKGTSD